MKLGSLILALILTGVLIAAGLSLFLYTKLERRLDSAEKAASALEEDLSKLQESVLTVKTTLDEIPQLKERLSTTKEGLSTIEEKVSGALDEITDLKQELSSIKTETSKLQEELFATDPPLSGCGLDYYAQGGIVVDGTAYFTADHGYRRKGRYYRKSPDFPYLVSFDAETFRKIRSYDFEDTYDSSPLIVYKKDGTPLLLAHEYIKERTKAVNVKTGNTEWISDPNQPGEFFFGYSYFLKKDGSAVILGAFKNGLHALSAENGKELWTFPEKITESKISEGGVTPAVDQKNAMVYYQCNGRIIKLDADTGKVLKSKNLPPPNLCISWNTVLVDDANGYYIATYWYGYQTKPRIRVFDKDLTLVWETEKGIPAGKKTTLTYAKGMLVAGIGDIWSKERYSEEKWKYIKAYSIKDGKVLWSCNLSGYSFEAIHNVPYFNGYFYAETQDSPGFSSKLFRIKADDGTIESVLDYGRPHTSCAPAIIAQGMLLSGDLWSDRVIVTRLAENSKADWNGPFADPQKNYNSSPDEKGVVNVAMKEIAPAGQR